MFGEEAMEFLKVIDMQRGLQGRVLVTHKTDPGGQRKRLVHAGIAYIEDVVRQDLECVEYSFHNFGMGLGVSDVGGAKHEVEIFPQVELFEKLEGGNGAVCRQGGPEMLLGQLEERDDPRFASEVAVERAEIDSFEVFEGAVEILGPHPLSGK